uniref:Uncharacterized protein n=1 Tax=Rousettus aegyptiacus TaxID=9407 RepID=A0A7J8ILT0_ROUAE|nr:hypothetical protein HJG63_010757 [Rousettus aegyptiacus]
MNRGTCTHVYTQTCTQEHTCFGERGWNHRVMSKPLRLTWPWALILQLKKLRSRERKDYMSKVTQPAVQALASGCLARSPDNGRSGPWPALPVASSSGLVCEAWKRLRKWVFSAPWQPQDPPLAAEG